MKVFVGGLYPDLSLFSNTNASFKSLLVGAGFENVNKLEEADIFVSVNVRGSELESFLNYGKDPRLTFLIRNEPKTVWPKNYAKGIENDFGHVFDLGKFNDSLQTMLFWPQFWHSEFKDIKNRHEKGVVIVAGNKLCFIKGELYSLRRKCIAKIPQIHLFGTEWNKGLVARIKTVLIEVKKSYVFCNLPKFQSVKYWFKNSWYWNGSPSDKYSCLNQYKYSLVI